MLHSLPRAIAAAVLGALAGAACLVVGFAWNPAVTFDMDRALPAFATGFHPPERAGQDTFAWTSERAEVTLAGLDRLVPWTCSVRFRGARSSDVRQPDLRLSIDGVLVQTARATNAFRAVEIAVPGAPGRRGLTLTLASTETVAPGGDDSRRLGVQVDEVSCQPASGIVLPPRRALWTIALAAALLGAGFALTGITAASAIGAAVVMAAGQALVVISRGAQFGAFPETAVHLALWISCAMVVFTALLEFFRKQPLRNTARFVITFSAGTVYLQLLALLHPSTPIVNGLFHAHRLNDVLAGLLYSTQPTLGVAPFPHAIGLYLFAAPWAPLTVDHVALLRVVVSGAEIVAGALLYLIVVRAWGNRLTAAVAVALFSLVPVTYGLVGNADLTSVFGQAVSTVAVAVLVLSAERLRASGPFVSVVALVTFGFICHVNTLFMLTSTLVAVTALFFWFGVEPIHSSARRILLVTVVALLASAALYWGHFGDVYARQLEHMRAPRIEAHGVSGATDGQGLTGSAQEQAAAAKRVQTPARPRAALRLPRRAWQAFDHTIGNLGWPIVLLALVGLWRMAAEGGRDRLGLVIGAWAIVCLGFVAFSVLSPGPRTDQQDALELVGRVEHATMPAAVLLAARGATWGWRSSRIARLASIGLMASAVVLGIRAWAAWLG
jgi:hypothetical protein